MEARVKEVHDDFDYYYNAVLTSGLAEGPRLKLLNAIREVAAAVTRGNAEFGHIFRFSL